ncbi:iron-containing redox enzyme family protein [Aeromonas jandaei]|uniref:iron-containing redox enzyme family protein n=1 Tax=Aeromonas jandaei TaxID=650 RepID=UPI001115B7A5|nr:iron-containing redox enzyme family protein [Aeromonas jandaei]
MHCLSSGVHLDENESSFIINNLSVKVPSITFNQIRCGEWEKIDINIILELLKIGVIYKIDTSIHVHWSHLCKQLIDAIHKELNSIDSTFFLSKITSGTANIEQAKAWVRTMFDFTKLASNHIGHIVNVCNEKGDLQSAKYWERFYNEEKNHWHIYRNIFTSMGLDITREFDKPPYKEVKDFVDFLKSCASISEYHYAALLYAIEMGPQCDELHDDPQFYSLVKYYGFSERDVIPLFLHTKLNDDIGHASIWREVLSKKENYTKNEADSILHCAINHINLFKAWMDSLERI